MYIVKKLTKGTLIINKSNEYLGVFIDTFKIGHNILDSLYKILFSLPGKL